MPGPLIYCHQREESCFVEFGARPATVYVCARAFVSSRAPDVSVSSGCYPLLPDTMKYARPDKAQNAQTPRVCVKNSDRMYKSCVSSWSELLSLVSRRVVNQTGVRILPWPGPLFLNAHPVTTFFANVFFLRPTGRSRSLTPGMQMTWWVLQLFLVAAAAACGERERVHWICIGAKFRCTWTKVWESEESLLLADFLLHSKTHIQFMRYQLLKRKSCFLYSLGMRIQVLLNLFS